MKINIKTVSLITIIFFIFFIFFLSLNSNQIYDTKNIIGKKIENFKIQKFNENGFITDEILLENKFSLINFWASWCSPCREEHPALMQLKNYKNLNLIGINFKDKKNHASSFLDELGNPFKILLSDKEGKSSIEFGVYGIPESILFNDKSIILKKYVGPLSPQDVDEIIELIK